MPRRLFFKNCWEGCRLPGTPARMIETASQLSPLPAASTVSCLYLLFLSKHNSSTIFSHWHSHECTFLPSCIPMQENIYQKLFICIGIWLKKVGRERLWLGKKYHKIYVLRVFTFRDWGSLSYPLYMHTHTHTHHSHSHGDHTTLLYIQVGSVGLLWTSFLVELWSKCYRRPKRVLFF
jgi:hypothetical protein